MQLDEKIREALEASGVDQAALGDVLSVREAPAPMDVDAAELHALFARAMRTYLAERSGQRPIELPDLAVAILRAGRDDPDGLLPRRLEKLDINFDSATAAMESLVEALPARRRPLWARYASDEVPATGAIIDHLRVRQEAEALAWVITADEMDPPLSVGLFGDWGSGKTTFMRLLQEEIDQITSDARTAHESNKAYPFCDNVRHIWFNAWHYVDANLWASLVSHLFEELSESTQEFRNLVGRLKTTEALTTNAQQRQAEGMDRRTEAETELTQVRTEKEQLTRDLAQGKIDLTTLDADKVIEEKGEHVLELLGKTKDGSSIVPVARDLSHLAKRATYVRELFRAQPRWFKWMTAGLVAAALIGGALALTFPDETAKLFGLLTSALVLVGSLAAALKKPVSGVREAARQVTDLAESAGRAQIANMEQRERELQIEITEARRQEEEARRELRDIGDGRRLSSYVEERLRSDDYRKQLGIIALIRRDFEELTNAMHSDRKARLRVRSANLEADTKRTLALEEEGEQKRGLPQIDRIVLYIDDLDRCPAERVVEVLEAVHLLLAFRLFVVVVGVDSRWLFTSLERHYWAQLGSDTNPASQGDRHYRPDEAYWASTPQNYLEKIFQIPFALRPMGSGGYEQLVSELLKAPPRNANDLPTRASGAPVPGIDEPKNSHGPAQPEGSTASRSEPRTPPDALFVSDEELRFLISKEMSRLIPTPRGAKRIANTYRLLRASLDETGMKRFLPAPDGEGEFRVVALLLGVIVGFPNQASALFQALFETDEASWWDFVEHLPPADANGSDDVSAEGTGGDNGEPLPGEDDSWTQLSDSLHAFQVEGTVPGVLDLYQFWAGPTARYSFQTGRLARVGGQVEEGSGDSAS
jgi:hypothetical protein